MNNCITPSHIRYIFFVLRIRCTPSSTLFPYTTLFRSAGRGESRMRAVLVVGQLAMATVLLVAAGRSEEHTSELQSRMEIVCRLLLEIKKCEVIIPIILHLIDH